MTNEIDKTKPDINDAKELLDADISQVLNDLVEEKSYQGVKDLTALFNIAQIKHNAIRITTYNALLDKIGAEMTERILHHPESFSNEELVKYSNAVLGVLDKATEHVEKLDEVPPIQLNQQNNTVNVNVGIEELDRDSRDRILQAIKSIIEPTDNIEIKNSEDANE